jgi:putative SOS response-associated peptidase YedK
MNWHNLCLPAARCDGWCGRRFPLLPRLRASKAAGRADLQTPLRGQDEDMCGRYASARKSLELLEEFRVERDRVSEPLQADYNVAPTKRVYAVVSRVSPPGDGPDSSPADSKARAADSAASALAGTGAPAAQRELRVVRWGLVPSWAKDRSIGSRMINARAETVHSKPAFRRAFARRRCLLPADGYYEWQQPEGAGGVKQPYFITRGDGGPLAFAGLYELWRDPALPPDDELSWLWTATIITTSAPDELGHIHDRMPMVIQPDNWADWLDPAIGDTADVMPLLVPAAAQGLTSYPVSTAVNSVRNNGPQLIERVQPADAGQPGPAGGDAGPGTQPSRPSRSRGAASGESAGSGTGKQL